MGSKSTVERCANMSRRKKLLAGLGAMGLILIGISCRNAATSDFDSERLQCQRNMRSALSTIREYVVEHNGSYPPSLDVAYAEIGFSDPKKVSTMLRCPGFRESEHVAGTVALRSGYVYVDWSKWFSPTNPVPNEYPVIYDGQLRNHRNMGVNVLLMDGTFFWDENASWIQNFSRKHPEYRLQIPK